MTFEVEGAVNCQSVLYGRGMARTHTPLRNVFSPIMLDSILRTDAPSVCCLSARKRMEARPTRTRVADGVKDLVDERRVYAMASLSTTTINARSGRTWTRHFDRVRRAQAIELKGALEVLVDERRVDPPFGIDLVDDDDLCHTRQTSLSPDGRNAPRPSGLRRLRLAKGCCAR